MLTATSGALRQPLERLYYKCKENERNLLAASALMQNPGLKLLFRRFAQQHSEFAMAIMLMASQLDATIVKPGRYDKFLQRGWFVIRIGMIVGRAKRQHTAAYENQRAAAQLIHLYDRALQSDLPVFVQDMIAKQEAQIRQIHQWLHRISTSKQWVVRLYSGDENAKDAVSQLEDAGFTSDKIEVEAMDALTEERAEEAERVRITVDAALTGALFGAVIGALVGIIMGFITPYVVPTVPTTESIVWTSLLGSGLIGLVVGASFFSLFGFLLGQGTSEDDTYLSERIGDGKEFLVSVQTDRSNYQTASKILHVWHERSVKRVPASSRL